MVADTVKGGAFLAADCAPVDVFTPEDWSAEHKAIEKTAAEFFDREVTPAIDAMQRGEHARARALLEKAAELGLAGILIPEQYGGMELDFVSSCIAAEQFGRDGSFAVWYGGQTGIGLLPLLRYGTEEQKQRLLPKLVTAEMLAAYSLSEPQAGSDAAGIRTRADLSADGTHYVLNGQKMWVTNGGLADLYTVFAKVGGEKVTAFLVERGFPGVQPGAEENKMGLKGSSTTAVFLDNVRVPVGNVLGGVGQGLRIGLSILNIGRLKLAFNATGLAKEALALSLRYARQRVAFGKPIGEFGLIRHKLAEMAARIYAMESMAWRIAGYIDAAGAGGEARAAEEYAVECSYAKVFASEAMAYVADEGVQIHGGYGFHHDYPIERIYRDARIQRIFEGTNEINRIAASRMLLKRARAGAISLEGQPTAPLKRLALAGYAAAQTRFGDALGEEQEVLAALTDLSISAFALESASLRAEKSQSALSNSYVQLLASFLTEQAVAAARPLFAACDVAMPAVEFPTMNSFALRREIAARLLSASRYLS
jgi:alkylation response protein AidB-like acyl-CoA dehydrogenase